MTQQLICIRCNDASDDKKVSKSTSSVSSLYSKLKYGCSAPSYSRMFSNILAKHTVWDRLNKRIMLREVSTHYLTLVGNHPDRYEIEQTASMKLPTFNWNLRLWLQRMHFIYILQTFIYQTSYTKIRLLCEWEKKGFWQTSKRTEAFNRQNPLEWLLYTAYTPVKCAQILTQFRKV